MTSYLLTTLGVSFGINLLMFLIAFRYKTDKLTDISYAVSFVTLAIFGLASTSFTGYRLLLFLAVTVWAVRLGSFLLYRVWKKGKDGRFDEMRNSFWKFGRFWVGQALAVWVILIPSLLALKHGMSPRISLLLVLALAVWLVGVIIEGTSDLQKYRFSQVPGNHGHWIQNGLWNYSRHPNYLGEIMVWLAIYCYALPSLTQSEALVGLVSPIFITALLLLVSGIPILEKSADKKWGSDADYQAYKRRTSVLFLLPHRK